MANDPTDLNQYPIGSTSFVPAGAPDIGNASVLDKLINGGNIEVENRAGSTLPSYEKAIADSQLAYGGLTNKGDWAAATSYLVNDIWKSTIDGTWYLVLQNYTSGASEQADIDAGYVQVWQGFSKIDVIARHNGVQTSNVSTLSLSTISSVNYLYDDATETTYYCPQELTGTISSLGTDADGIRTITVDSVDYLIYSEIHYSLLKESINYATSNLTDGDGSLVGVIYKGVTIDSLEWLTYPNDGRIYFNDGETGSFVGDFDPSTGIDSGLSGALSVNPAITESRMSSAESAISQNESDVSSISSNLGNSSSLDTATAAEITAGTEHKVVTADELASSSFVEGKMNAAGSAPMFAGRAKVNFNGSGTIAIRDSGNILSVTDLGTGIYRITFIENMTTADFVVAGSRNGLGTSAVTDNTGGWYCYDYSVDGFTVRNLDSNAASKDAVIFNLVVF